MQQRRGTAAQWTAADPVLGAGEIGFETDTGKFKMGDGTSSWTELYYFLDSNDLDLGGSLDDYVPLTQKGANNGVATLDSAGKVPLTQLGNIIDGAPETLNTLNEIAAAISDDPLFYSAVTTLTDDVADLETTVSGIQADLTTAEGDIDNLQTLTGQLDTAVDNLDLNKAPLASPTFTGTVILPSTTSIGDVSNTEISYLNGVTSDIQTQLDGKLASSTASSTYAPLSGPTFTGTVTLPSTTSVGSVSDTELGYLDGVTSAIQTQIDAKAPTANPTFTGTVSGVTKDHVGLGNVDNTSDANKPVSTATQTALDLKANLAGPTFTGTVVLPSTTSIGDVSATELGYLDGVTSALQTQLDSKLNLSGGTLTGALTLSGAPTSDLHAATKQYVDGLAAGINFHQPVVAATAGNLAGTYNNGTNGVGATITASANGSIGTIDGVSVSVGNRILLRAQTDAKENGIYTITAVGSAGAPWVVTRATDADNSPSGELANGDFTFVTSGSTNGSKGFIVSTTGAITIGTTEITYAQFNASEAVIAGDGITKTGATISIGTGAITSSMILDGTIVDADINASAEIAQSKISGLSSSLAAKADLASPTFTGTVTVGASGIAFTDGTQTKEGVPSRTAITQVTAAYNLSTGGLSLRDGLIEVSHTGGSSVAVTIPTDATTNFPIGTSIDVLRTNTGGVSIAGAAGVTVNATPGLNLRAQWSSVTLFKRAANTWVAFGDLAS